MYRYDVELGLVLQFTIPGKPVQTRESTQLLISSMRAIGIWKRHSHPKGMLGKHHTPELRLKQSERAKKMWKDPKSKFNSEERAQKLSDARKEWMSSHKVSNPYSRAKRGKRSDLGNTFFKSRWEANFARYLEFLKKSGNIYSWEYEPQRFEFEAIKRGTRSYLPDFGVCDKEGEVRYFYEVKGWMDDKSRVRLNRMRIYFPETKIILIAQKEYKEIEKTIGPLIPLWEKA